MSPTVVLVGPPGAGKSIVGRKLADRLAVTFRDTDGDVEKIAGKPISEIFTVDGEAHFRSWEQQAVSQAIAEHGGVLALGGGAVLSEHTRANLSGQPVVLLSVGLSEGVRRTGLSTARPLLTGVNPRATFRSLLDARLPLYREVATWEIPTDELGPDAVVDSVIEKLMSTSPATIRKGDDD